MKKSLTQTIKVIILGTILCVGIAYAAPWSGAPTSPTGGNISAPVTVGGSPQGIGGPFYALDILSLYGNLGVGGELVATGNGTFNGLVGDDDNPKEVCALADGTLIICPPPASCSVDKFIAYGDDGKELYDQRTFDPKQSIPNMYLEWKTSNATSVTMTATPKDDSIYDFSFFDLQGNWANAKLPLNWFDPNDPAVIGYYNSGTDIGTIRPDQDTTFTLTCLPGGDSKSISIIAAQGGTTTSGKLSINTYIVKTITTNHVGTSQSCYVSYKITASVSGGNGNYTCNITNPSSGNCTSGVTYTFNSTNSSNTTINISADAKDTASGVGTISKNVNLTAVDQCTL